MNAGRGDYAVHHHQKGQSEALFAGLGHFYIPSIGVRQGNRGPLPVLHHGILPFNYAPCQNLLAYDCHQCVSPPRSHAQTTLPAPSCVQIGFSFAVYPAIIVAYLGQGAYLLQHPENVSTAFYSSVPEPFFW